MNSSNLYHIAGRTVIRFTDTDPALLDVDAVVEEQDTSLVLGNAPVVREVTESLPALLRRMEQQTEEKPGTVIIHHARPMRFIAVVYDINHDPICLEEWVAQALEDIFLKCEKFRIHSLAMPVLGTRYGKYDADALIRLLQTRLLQKRQAYPGKIYFYRLD